MSKEEKPEYSEILNFIACFSKSADVFLKGMCYWFAHILCSRFKADMMYLPIRNHFITRIDGHMFDASGDITGQITETPYLWKDYAKRDTLHTARITEDCILKKHERGY